MCEHRPPAADRTHPRPARRGRGRLVLRADRAAGLRPPEATGPLPGAAGHALRDDPVRDRAARERRAAAADRHAPQDRQRARVRPHGRAPAPLMRTAAVALLGLALVAGCSGGDGRLSKAEYAQQADALCTKYDAELAKLPSPTTLEALARMAAQAKAVAAEGASRLRALQPPAELQKQADEWLALNDKNVDDIEAMRKAAAANDRVKVQEIARDAQRNEAKADKLARKLGLKSCASSTGR